MTAPRVHPPEGPPVESGLYPLVAPRIRTRIRTALAAADRDQKDVAAWLGFHPSQVTKRMHGDIEWRLSELITIAKHLRVPISALLDDREAVSR